MSQGSLKGKVVLGFLGFLALLALCVAGGSFIIIDPGERGVIVRLGKVTEGSFSAGLNWKTPFIDHVDIMNIQVRKFELPMIEASSKDLQTVKTSVTVNYRLNPSGVAAVRRELGRDDPEIQQSRVIQPSLEESIKSITAKYRADELLTQRARVRNEMQELLQVKLNNVIENGFSVVEFAITDFSFSDTFNNAIEAKVEAEQSAIRTENQVREAKAEAQKSIAIAEGRAQAVRIAAAADAEAIRVRAAAFKEHPEILRLDFVNKWDGRMPMVLGGEGQDLMLGIGELPVGPPKQQ